MLCNYKPRFEKKIAAPEETANPIIVNLTKFGIVIHATFSAKTSVKEANRLRVNYNAHTMKNK